MPVPKEIQDHLDARNFDAVEDAWLTRLDDRAGDTAFFAEAGQALDRAGETDRARVLLEMVDEGLRDSQQWSERLELLRLAGPLYVEAKKLHPRILKTVSRLYGHYPSFEEMLEKVGLRRAVDDIPKTWKKVDRLGSLLDFDVGSIVFLEGKGAGRVTEVNMALESFKVELSDHPDIRVGFGGAAKLLKPLRKGHVLRRKLEAYDELAALSPPELLRVVLESYEEPRTGAEIRRDLAGVVEDRQWSSWWTAARKHPQVLSAPGGRRAYSWAASSDHAEDAVWQAFEGAEPRTRLELLRHNAGRDSDLRRRMAEDLSSHAASVAEDDPGLACEIWFGLERHGLVDDDVAWSPPSLIARLTNKELAATAAGIKDRTLRERIYMIGSEKRPDWTDLAARLVWQETDARPLDTLAESLPADVFDTVFDQLVSQPRKNPAAFTWLAERAKDEPAWLARNPVRLLKQILWSLSAGAEFSPLRSRLLPLVDSGGTVPRMLDHLNEDQAAQFAETLAKTAAILDYQRQPLMNALALRFPGLREDEEAPLYATADMIEQKHEELRQLVEEEIPANRRAIEEARELGDLRENFEYKSARQRHEYLAARASALDRDLRRVRPIDPSIVDGTEVVIGSRVVFENDTESRTITILGPWNSLPEEDVLSNESELAQSLLGSKKGQTVRLDDGTYRIARIEPYVPAGQAEDLMRRTS